MFRDAAVGVALVLFLGSTAFADPLVTGAITGRVAVGRDAAANVSVTATSPALLRIRTTTTGPRGTYRIADLPPGKYEVTFSRSGLTSLTRSTVVELARTARVDASLEVSEDEESVTSTARTVDVADTTAVTAHFSDALLDRLPVRRAASLASILAPGFAPSTPMIDGVPLVDDSFLGQEEIEQLTLLRAGIASTDNREAPDLVSAVTHSGGSELTLVLRDTVTSDSWLSDKWASDIRRDYDGLRHFLEAAAGGPLVADKLRFFVAGWRGDSAERIFDDAHGYEIKLTAAPTDDQTLVAERLDIDGGNRNLQTSLTSVRYAAMPNARWTIDASAYRHRRRGFLAMDDERLLLRSSSSIPTAWGDHVVTTGASVRDTADERVTSLFAGDRWRLDRWTIDANLFHTSGREDHTSPQVAATYDLRGDGRRAIIATYSEYEIGALPFHDETLGTIGYAFAIGSSGSARADLARRTSNGTAFNELQLDARYRLFDRFAAGGDFAISDIPSDRHTQSSGAGWFTADFPIGTSTLETSLLERYVEGFSIPATINAWLTDLALRYTFPLSHTHITLATDLTNLFDTDTHAYAEPRAVRVWVRLAFR